MLHPFQTPSHAKRTYRELKLLQHLTHRDAQVCTNHSFVFSNIASIFHVKGYSVIECILS